MTVGHAFLGLLEGGPQHGYTLKHDYDRWFSEGRQLKFGQVYATLGRLERDGLASVTIESGDGPDRKSYTITDHGVEELESWLDSPVAADAITLGPLYTRVVVALVSGRSVDDVLSAQRSVHLVRMRELRAQQTAAGLERQLALDLLIGHLQADLEWIELAAARLATPRTGSVVMIEAKQVSYSFGATPALREVSVAIGAGEAVAIMGRSGSGKSTLLHCLAGLLVPDTGEIWFQDLRLDDENDNERSARRLRDMGLVFQFGHLVPELSLVENVALPLMVTGTNQSEAQERAVELLGRLDVAELADRRPAEVSGGQMQRATIARSLVHRPAVVFADEPTGALDSVTGQLALEALLAAARLDGAAVVMVTHEARLASYCDREIVMRDGAVA